MGINPANMFPNNYCNITENSTALPVGNAHCSSFIDQAYVTKQLKDTKASTNTDDNIVKLSRSLLYTAGATVPDDCKSNDSNFFLQYSCVQS